MPIIPSVTSRYIGVPIVTDADGRQLYEIRQPMTSLDIVGVRRRRVSGSETLHHIAFDEYGDAQLFWAIADYNLIFDVTTEVTVGTELLIPPRLFIEQFLTRGV